ncbi:phosphatidylinositol 4-kinase gamma 6 [Selaginella moellendorffii]|nr:phosphatidylinositol 4-kinase gamma 6 [Selaginella moellendorffii]|eukprot:XP_002985052.2 phosphatidylinositol 4-kinase gamma 6 [Selaginella moellendorffii]
MPPEAPSLAMAMPELEQEARLLHGGGGGGGGDGQGKQQWKKQQGWRRRIFVQTDNGSVLGMEVHRSDKVQSIKKKIQAVLRISTENSDLSFGDHVLEDDVSELRCDSPVLLARSSTIHRSFSTPCLCPSKKESNAAIFLGGEEEEEDSRGPFEIVGGWSCCARIKRLIQESCAGIERGVEPLPAQGGLGGAYYFRDRHGKKIAIVKPADEEPLAPNNPRGFVGRRLGQAGLSRSIRVGETGIREVAAYLLDHGHFAQVPATVLVKAVHPIFHINSAWSRSGSKLAKIGSFQEFVEHDYEASECGCSRFPASAVHRVGILDVRLFNTDRHAGNILVRHNTAAAATTNMCNSVELIPIDHGLCLPESIEDPYFEWLHWPQASFPFSEEELDYIRVLDPAKDADMLRKQLPMLKEACIRMMILCTSFLKRAAEAGLCLAEVGSMMSRELDDSGETCSSELEKMCTVARDQAAQESALAGSQLVTDESENEKGGGHEEDDDDEEQVFEIDMDEQQQQQLQLISPSRAASDAKNSPRTSPVKKQLFRSVSEMQPVREEEEEDDGDGEDDDDDDLDLGLDRSRGCCSSCVTTPSSSIGRMNFKKKKAKKKRASSKGFASASAHKRSTARPAETSLALSSLCDREWNAFMRCFHSVCGQVLERHNAEKGSAMIRLQQMRLGTSCQF